MDPTRHQDPPAIHAHLLGPFRLSLGDRPIPADVWPRRGVRSLLLRLLATPGHALPRDRVLEDIWPGSPPPAALNALYVALHSLRRVLEPELRAGRASSYVDLANGILRLRPETVAWVDVDAFEAELERPGDPGRHERLAAALALYAGDLLADELYVDWPVPRREHLRGVWRDAALEHADLERASGWPLRALPVLGSVLQRDPADEPAHRALMRALAAGGRRDDALRQYDRCRRDLEQELGVEPGAETVALRVAIADASPPPTASFPTPPQSVLPRFDNLPAAPNALIGRTRELDALLDLIWDRDVRLVTVTGPGGIGKTRLAIEAATQVAGDFAGGACFVTLAGIREPGLVLPTLARTLGVAETTGHSTGDALRDALRERALLLVLDNMEQLVAAAADIADLLAACPHLKVLVTSREPLRLRAEHVFPVPPLAVPRLAHNTDPDRLTASAAQRFEAVALFAERARAAQASFALTGENAGAVAAICQRLDGLPLAIELAAARSRHLTPAELRTRLTTRLPLLTGGARDLPPRQRTMRDAIAWSHDLLPLAEQALFRRLSVFTGGIESDAAEQVITLPSGSVLDGIASLVDKNLLWRGEDDVGSRFGMFETIREYGAERLEASGEVAATRDAHAAYFATLAETAAAFLHGAHQSIWLERLHAEHDNLRAALGWACEQRAGDTALRLAAALADFWRMRGHLREGRAWLERALSLTSGEPDAVLARALAGAGNLARTLGDHEPAADRLSAALAAWRHLGDQRGIGQTLGTLADVAIARGNYEEAIVLNQEALEIFEAIGDQTGTAEVLNRLGIIATDRGQHERATGLYERSLAIFRALAHRHGEARVLNNLGTAAFWRAEYHKATTLHEASLALWREMGNRPHAAIVLANLGEDLRASGDLERAQAITAEGLQLSRELGDKRATATALFVLGGLYQHDGADPRALDPLVDAILLYQQIGDRLGMAWCLEALAGPATAAGSPALAATLCGAADALRDQVGIPLQPAERPAHDRHVTGSRSALGQLAFAEAWATGRTLSLEEVVARATGLSRAQDPTTHLTEYPATRGKSDTG